jgi:superfamily II DNA or RNA helicase
MLHKTYPKFDDKNFYSLITKKYDKYKISNKHASFKEICFPKSYNLQNPQKFLAEYINPKTPYKSILIFHRIGAGKTCTAVNICEQWKKIRKIVIITPASLKGNFRDELRSPCAGNEYLSDNDRKILAKNHPSSEKYKDIIEKSDKKINKYYSIYSYNKFVQLYVDKKISLKNSLLVVDEIQNMVSQTGTFYKVLYKAIHSAPSDLRIVLLSATPMFDKPVEIALTMNLLRLPKEFPIGKEFDNTFIKISDKNNMKNKKAKNLDLFKKMIKGYISYFRGAPPYTFPNKIVKYVKCEMSNFQYRSYITVLKNEEKNMGFDDKRRNKIFTEGDIGSMPNNFFIGTRIISNVAFPNKNRNEDGYNSFIGKNLKFDNLKEYSIKFYKILKRIYKSFGTSFVYSNFKGYGGIKSFSKVLDYYGFKNYANHGEGPKRYAIWTGEEKSELKDEIKAVFNQESNYNGSKIKILLLSPSAKEGISFKRIQQAHIMEPYWNISRLEQIIGRAVRYCSHKDMPIEKRTVKVYIYIATHPNEKLTVDQYIKKLALQKDKLIDQFTLAMKESAIDCTLFKNANVYTKLGESLTCDI